MLLVWVVFSWKYCCSGYSIPILQKCDFLMKSFVFLKIIIIVNGLRYWNILTNFFLPIFDDMDVSDMWFWKNGATCHTVTETLNLFRTKFPDRIILPDNSPPWSCDLTPLGYFLWGYGKNQVCRLFTIHWSFKNQHPTRS